MAPADYRGKSFHTRLHPEKQYKINEFGLITWIDEYGQPRSSNLWSARDIAGYFRDGTWILEKEKDVAQPKFHSYMNEMTITLEKEFERDGVPFIRGKDKKGRNFVVPKGWLDKASQKAKPVPAEPEVHSVVTLEHRVTKERRGAIRKTGGWWTLTDSVSHWPWTSLMDHFDIVE